MKTPRDGRISSPVSTGGAGTFFEQHVGAYWLAQLLVAGIPPIFTDTTVAEVSFQTQHIGWETDDFLVACETAASTTRKLAGQVKLNFTVSASDDQCKQTIQDFWKDFKNAELFSLDLDRLVLVTQRGSNQLLRHFSGLLDCARAAGNGDDFATRLSTEGFVSSTALRHCGEIQKIITEYEGHELSASDIWSFLSVLHLLPLDVFSSTNRTEADIKRLLAHTVTEGNSIETAGATWNELLTIASAAMSGALVRRRNDLPGELRERHGPIGTSEQRLIGALKDHTEPVLNGIRTTIGQGFHLQRPNVVQDVLDKLESAQIVVLSGPAGIGKSGIAKEALSLLGQNHFAFGFRAEEFSEPHLDNALQSAQIPGTTTALRAVLAAQGRKVFLVESIERLLERSTRDAFSDLIRLVASDPTMRVVLTCRDYSRDQVITSFLQPVGIEPAVAEIPRLDSSELDRLETAFPEIARPLGSPPLRDLLRNPYIVDKALQISWTESDMPRSEREFRDLFWQQIVRDGGSDGPGMAQKRVSTLEQLAVQRASALSPYVSSGDWDEEVIASLRRDSLIRSPEGQPTLVATAHDVLEDWAILQWINERYLAHERSPRKLSEQTGPYPAIRRSYRKWITELVEIEPMGADRFFEAAIFDSEIRALFRDDTLISVLQAPAAPDFLRRHESKFFADDRALLKRAIHLLRVACVKTPEWLGPANTQGSVFNVPDGLAWSTVLELVHRNIDNFTRQESQLLLGLIEDASRGVAWWSPTLDSGEAVASIGYWLLPAFDDYSSDDLLRRTLQVLAKIPNGNADRFEALLRGTGPDSGRYNHISRELREIIYSGLDGLPAARDLPDVVISVASEHMLATDEDARSDGFRGRSLDLYSHFGIKSGLGQAFFPASALHGPWFHLLRHHPRKGLDFLIKVFDHSAEWYANPRVDDRLEPPSEIELTFADGTTRKQWGNERMWCLYRDTHAGPDVLESMLMALEKWLLEFAEQFSERLDKLLLDILRKSDSGSLAAVVASVATAYPHESGESLLVLMSAPEYIALDRNRLLRERDAGAVYDILPNLNVGKEAFYNERRQANQLEHRQFHLENAILSLQFGGFATRVQSILDSQRAALPPIEEQNDKHRVLRLAMHRMDLRKQTVTETPSPPTPEGAPTDSGSPSDEQVSAGRVVHINSKELEPDLKAMVDDSSTQLSAFEALLDMHNWAYQVFGRNISKTHSSAQWRQYLSQAMSTENTDKPDEQFVDMIKGGSGIVAAVCVRDHWEEMTGTEQEWCANRVCRAVMASAYRWDFNERIQRHDSSADRSSAQVLSLLRTKRFDQELEASIAKAFAAAITHPINEVRWHAVWGVRENLWFADRSLALRCLNTLATEAALNASEVQRENAKDWNKRRDTDEIMAEVTTAIRKSFLQQSGIPNDAVEQLDIGGSFGAETNAQILTILSSDPDDPFAVTAYARTAKVLVGWWDADDATDRREMGRERNYDTENTISKRLQEFVMQTKLESAQVILEPILDAVDRHPREINAILDGLRAIEDREPRTSHYWSIWQLFADAIESSGWGARFQKGQDWGSEIMAAIFLRSWWKDDVRHWKSLEGYAHRVHQLFERLPVSSIVLDDYCSFLYHIGEQSLPEAFVPVANSLARGDPQVLLSKSNTIFTLEVMLQRHVYGRPLELKQDLRLRNAVLSLLDALVENGSSAAFRMRDDFVTPAT